ncbi:DUF4113 domain-containing protein [Methylobacterium sp. C25]|uniref:DUF4113 domain-containing protein n=1 Tax=Methylobacterium sp. C25 TaxID=2721622 RepID=UPI001F19AF14|nr:DUF4113 domain-containing protein [Methylobacterium sp. C25]
MGRGSSRSLPALAAAPARAGLDRARSSWSTKFEMRTPRYSTRIDELPVALA